MEQKYTIWMHFLPQIVRWISNVSSEAQNCMWSFPLTALLIVQDNAKPHTGPLLWTIPYHNLIVSEGSIEKKNWTNKNNNLS